MDDAALPRSSASPPRFILVLGAIAVLLTAAIIAMHVAGRARRWQSMGVLVPDVPTSDSVVALTIDDGPNRLVVQDVIDTLRIHGARATFFLVGLDLARAVPAAHALVAAGHELGNHSWSHRHMSWMPLDTIHSEIERTDSLIRLAGQRDPIYFRPPFGYKVLGLPLVLARTGRTTIMWNIEPDTYDKSPEDMVRGVLARVHPGSIIVIHVWYNGREHSRAALGPMIDSLHARGYRVTTVGDLLGGVREPH